MPESVTDRPTKAHEYLFLLTRSPRYFYDQTAIAEPADWERWGDQTVVKPQPGTASWIKPKSKQELVGESRPAGRGDTYSGFNDRYKKADPHERRTRNRRSVWEIATEPYPDAHFATFPQALVEPCVLAGTSERGCCPECGAPWERETEDHTPRTWTDNRVGNVNNPNSLERKAQGMGKFTWGATSDKRTIGWRPACACGTGEWAELGQAETVHAEKTTPGARPSPPASGTTDSASHSPVSHPTCDCFDGIDEEEGTYLRPPVPCTVLDPFMGSGTTALVARRLGRKSIGIELNEEYARLCAHRLRQLSLLA